MAWKSEPSTKLSPLAAHSGLVLLVLHLIVAPYALGDINSLFGILIQAIFYALLIVILIDVATHRWQVVACISLVVIATMIRLMAEPAQRGFQSTAGLSLVLCGIVVLYLAMRRILVTRQVDPALISGAVNVYLLAGVTWAVAYQAIELAMPGSYALPEESSPSPSDLYYFSFVTLTTLGYGDIRPVTDLARSVAVLESVFGQIFLVVLLGRLVSLQISARQQNPLSIPKESKDVLSEVRHDV